MSQPMPRRPHTSEACSCAGCAEHDREDALRAEALERQFRFRAELEDLLKRVRFAVDYAAGAFEQTLIDPHGHPVRIAVVVDRLPLLTTAGVGPVKLEEMGEADEPRARAFWTLPLVAEGRPGPDVGPIGASCCSPYPAGVNGPGEPSQ